ncbi:MAG: hypothetical protein RR465_01295, partial [Mucinivorans sp.]
MAGANFFVYINLCGVQPSVRFGSEKRSFQEQLRKKRNHSEPIQKNAVFQEKFWVTFSKVTIRHGAG